MTFRALLYTDCRADESLRGGTGYQFQAASPDARAADEMVMMQELMYRPSPDLMAREAPVDQYPPSFAFFRAEDGYAMAAGTYLGQVSGDGRQGNQITHGLFTDDADDFAGTRPAQFFGADLWVYDKQQSKHLPSIEPPLLYDDAFDLPELHQLATRVGGANEFLAKLISAFEGAAGDTAWVKAIVSCSDPRTAMQWIALGTVLLPAEQAMSLSIRAFVSEPVSATQRIVAVHPPSMNKSPDVCALSAASGIDLDTHATGLIELTDRATFWAERFIDGDPYEVIDAIGLADRLRAPDHASRVVAAAMILGETLGTASDLEAVGAVFETFDTEEYEDYAGQILEVVERLDERGDFHPQGFLRILPIVQRYSGMTSESLDRMQANLLHRAAISPSFARSLVADDAWRWKWHQQPIPSAQPARALAAVLAKLDSAALPGAFEFAARTGVPVDPAALGDAMARLAEYWTHNAQLSGRHRSWLHGDRVLDLLVQTLEGQAITGLPRAVESAAENGQWDWLLDLDWVVQGGGPLLAEIAGRSIPNADPRRQQQLIRLIAETAGPDGWQALWRKRLPSLDEVMLWLHSHPSAVRDPRFAGLAGEALGRVVGRGRIRGRDLRLIEDLYATAPNLLPRNVARLAEQNLALGHTLQRLVDRRADRDSGARLASIDPILLEIRMTEVVEALVNDAEVEFVVDFLQNSKVDVGENLAAAFDDNARHFPAEALGRAFLFARANLPKPILKQVKAFPSRWYESASDEDRARMAGELHRDYPEWEELEIQHERSNESTFKKVGRLFGGRER